jgi:UDP-glucose 6-dehydrogenase
VAVLGLSFKPGTPVTTASLGCEMIARLERRHVQIHAYDPMQQCRQQARAVPIGKSITWHDELQDALENADTIVICNPDPHFARVTADIPNDRYVIDPWGCIKVPHPRLVRPGRRSLSGNPSALA